MLPEAGVGTGRRAWARVSASFVALLMFSWPAAIDPRPPRPPTMPQAVGGRADLYVSSVAGDRLRQKPARRFGPAAAAGNRILFVIDDSVRMQRIDGFGASFLEAGLVTLNTLPSKEEQDAVLRALFDRQRGAGFTVMKTVIGSTDFQSATPVWYSYDPTPGDVGLVDFSIARDLGPAGVVTYIKRARQAGGEFVLTATMDYPPDWMLNDAQDDQDINPDYYSTLAMYFLEYLRQYDSNGVHIDYLSPFNEPGSYTKITYEELRDFLRDYLGPILTANPISTKLFLSEDGRRAVAAENYPVVLDDPGTRKYISGLPYHGYDWANWDQIRQLHSDYPDLPIWMTEICCNVDQAAGQSFEAGDFWGNQIVSELEAGASAWVYWNAILDDSGGPWLVSPVHGDGEGNSQNSVVVIDPITHKVSYTGLYYYLAHFSKYVRPGAHRIGTTASSNDDVRAISFENADGTLVTELINSRQSSVEVQVDWRGRSLTLNLPAGSISTLTWDPRTIK